MKSNASRLFSEKRFWQLISSSLDGTDSVDLTWDRQEKLLEQLLVQLSRKEFIGFAWHFTKYYWRAYRQDLWAVAYVVMGGCSDDCFMDFRTWLVTRGKPVCQAALRDPDSLCDEFDKIPKGDIPLRESDIQTLFDARFGDEAYDKVYTQYGFGAESEIRDPEHDWSSDDEDSIRRLCPGVFEKWWGNAVF